MNEHTASPLFRRLPLFATATLFLGTTGCGGEATVSSPFTVQQTLTQSTEQYRQTNDIDVAPTPQNTLQADTQNTTRIDPPAEQQITTNSAPSTAIPTEPTKQPIAKLTPADITDLVLVTGQSNALGADTAFDPELDAQDKRTFAFTDTGWQVADLHQIWDQGWFPRGDAVNGPSNNLSLHFGKRVTSADNNRVVGFILATAPGQPISHWEPNGDFFNSIRNKVSQAISELPAKSRIDGLLWHQGESDGEDDPAYGAALYALIDAFRSEGWYGESQPFICAETAELPVNKQLNRLNYDDDPTTACVAAEGLQTRGDGAHFNAHALRIIGRRYADQYLQMTR